MKESAEQMKREYDEISGLLAKLEESINQNREEMNRADLLKGNLEGQIGVLTEQINTERISAEHIGSRLMAIDREIGERQEKRPPTRPRRRPSPPSRGRWGDALRSCARPCAARRSR